MIKNIQHKTIELIFSMLMLFGFVEVKAQVTANCRVVSDAYLNFFGTDTVFAADLNNGSLNANRFLLNGEAYIVYDCSDIGNHPVVFTALDTMSGQLDTCITTVRVYDLIAPQATCANNLFVSLDSFGNRILQANELDPSGTSFDACGIVSYQINGNTSIALSCADTGTQLLVLTLTDANGNSSSCSSNVHISDPGICSSGPLQISIDTILDARCDTNVCTGVVDLALSGGYGPYILVWSDGLTATTVLRTAVCAGEYSITVTDAIGTTATLTIEVETLPGCVWPGDTDNRHQAGHFDLLPIALAYNEFGILRNNATTFWQGEPSANWNVSTSIIDLPDWKHIDASGDGYIDSLDLDVVLLNYDETYYPVIAVPLSPSGPIPCYVDTMQIFEGQSVTMTVNLGTLASAADSVYALAFSIVYDSSLVEPGSLQVSFDGSWLGSDLLTIYKDYPFNGRTEIALGRKDRKPITGSGAIAFINFTIRDDIFRAPISRIMSLDVENIRLINERNELKAVRGIAGQLIIDEANALTENNKLAPKLHVYPNPASNLLNIAVEGAEMLRWTVYNSAGQKVMEEANPNMLINIFNTTALPTGIYFISVQTDKNTMYKTVMIQH